MKKGSGKKKKAKPRARVRPKGSPATGQKLPANAVFLVGFMGAGKSTVGRALGSQLNWIFEDLDDRIEARAGRTVAEIFRDSGEAEFRHAEHEALREVLEELRRGTGRIIALGGGAFAQKKNAVLLKASGLPAVFLNAAVEELWQRCCSQASASGAERPLLRNLDDFRKLYRSRRAAYSKAGFTIRTDSRTVDAIAAEIVETLGLKKIAMRTDEGEFE